MDHRKILMNSLYFSLIGFFSFCFTGCQSIVKEKSVSPSQELRQGILDFTHQSLTNTQTPPASADFMPASEKEWKVTLQGYDQGNSLFKAEASANDFDSALQSAIDQVKSKNPAAGEASAHSRVYIGATNEKEGKLSLVEYQGKALEIVGDDLVAVRSLDKELIQQKVHDAKKYLLDAMDAKHYGFYKKYDAIQDESEKFLRTIYTASSLWTLMKISDQDADSEIARRIPSIADFLLSMQVQEGKYAGAFHYSYSLRHGTKKEAYVVGTASKTIFTMLELYRRFGEQKYLDAAEKAGNWLLSTQKEDGTLTTSFRLVDGKWEEGNRFSTLYHGQVLSALSRLYAQTKNEKYLAAANQLAKIIIRRAHQYNYFLQDDFRLSDDPVPTSWGVMSLLDFHKATWDLEAKDVLLELTNSLISRQYKDSKDLLNYGRFQGSAASSGNGWINEVFSELYLFGQKQNWDAAALEKVRQSILILTRWLVQNTYSPENSYFIKNPERAQGGLIRNFKEEAVRTDAVCHGINGYLNMLPLWPEGKLVEVPEDASDTKLKVA